MQLHVNLPSVPAKGESRTREQRRVSASLYETQVLDSYKARLTSDGQAGRSMPIPPLVNASRPPGQWQTYDIVFHDAFRERWQAAPPRPETVFQNGVLVQDNVELSGPKGSRQTAAL